MTAISHTGKRDLALTGITVLGAAGLAWVAGRRIELARLIAQPHGVGNFRTAIL